SESSPGSSPTPAFIQRQASVSIAPRAYKGPIALIGSTRSASRPPRTLPRQIPPRMIPITLVQAVNEAPTCRATSRLATSSRTMMQRLLKNDSKKGRMRTARPIIATDAPSMDEFPKAGRPRPSTIADPERADNRGGPRTGEDQRSQIAPAVLRLPDLEGLDHRPDVVHPDDVRPAIDGREGRDDRWDHQVGPGSADDLAEEPLPRGADQDGTAQVGKPVQVAQQEQVMLTRLAEADAGVEGDPGSGHPQGLDALDLARQGIADLDD